MLAINNYTPKSNVNFKTKIKCTPAEMQTLLQKCSKECIAKQFGVSIRTLNHYINRNNISSNNRKYLEDINITKDEVDKLIDEFGYTRKTLSEYLSISVSLLLKFMKINNMNTNFRQRHEAWREKVVKNSISIFDLSEKLNISLKNGQLLRRKYIGDILTLPKEKREDRLRDIIPMYERKMKIVDIARKIGVSTNLVQSDIKYYIEKCNKK